MHKILMCNAKRTEQACFLDICPSQNVRTISASYPTWNSNAPRGKNGVGILRRVFGALLKAMEESRQKQTEREIANYVALRAPQT
jgi:hypothetical protein